MEVEKAINILRDEMTKNGLYDWSISINNRKVRVLGSCKHRTQTIELSRKFIELNNEEIVRLTIIHEVAHGVVGKGHGHDIVWKKKCIELGGDGLRCAEPNTVIVPKAKYSISCENGCFIDYPVSRRMNISNKYCCKCNGKISLKEN